MAPNPVVCTLAIAAITLLSPESQGFALKKKDVENKLNEALRVIERKKRHVEFPEAGNTADDLAWDPRDVDMYNWEQHYPESLRSRYENTFDFPALRELYADRYLDEQSSPLDAYDWNALLGEDLNGDEEGGNGDMAEEEDQEEETPVSDEELEDIFDSAQNTEDKDEDKREYDPSQTAEKREDEEGLTQDEVNQLLSSADDALTDALSSDTDESDTESAPVTDDEIKDIFEDAENDTNDEDENVDTTDSESDSVDKNDDATGEKLPQDFNKEWLSQYIMNGAPAEGAISTKKKRSSWHSYPSPTSYGLASGASLDEDNLEELTNELAIAKADIKILKNFLALEDEENANLAKALNLATKSQTERTDKYVKDEINFIRDAIDDEVDLQEIKDVLQIAESLRESGSDEDLPEENQTEDDEEDTEGSVNSLEKRGYPEIDENDIDATDFPLAALEEMDEEVPLVEDGDEDDEEQNADDVDETISQLSSDDLVNIILANKLRDMLTRNNADDLNGVFGKQDDVQAWYGRPDVENVDDKEYYINPLMRELYEKLQVQNLDKRSEEFDNDLDEVTDMGDEDELNRALLEALSNSAQLCPAVDDLTDNCEFMTSLGLGLDDEATDLCNRHQLCYTCGAALGLTPNDCDRGYLAEAAMLCAEEDGCDEDAAGLFIIMLKYHSFQPLSRIPDQCADSCAEEYIAGRFNK